MLGDATVAGRSQLLYPSHLQGALLHLRLCLPHGLETPEGLFPHFRSTRSTSGVRGARLRQSIRLHVQFPARPEGLR